MSVIVLGVFVADAAFRAPRLPRIGETVLGQGFALGPGGKGSNQAVAAARAGARVGMITRLGDDAFAAMARDLWSEAGIEAHVIVDPDSYTGAAFIYVDPDTGANAIIVSPGAAADLSVEDIDGRAATIAEARTLLVQLEQPLPAAHRALQIAREAGVLTILNPAPAAELPDEMLALCDLVTPNESEAEALTGIPVTGPEDALRAAEALMARGAGAVVVTLGARGVLYHDGTNTLRLEAVDAGDVLDTTGAGDAFNGALAASLSEGRPIEEALRFANATAALSVTRAGAATSMPSREDVMSLLGR